MNLYSGHINKLIDELASLPGIGNKSAQNLAFHLINMPKEKVNRLAQVMMETREKICYCKECCTLTDKEICPVCANERRNHKVIMVVEDPRDMAAYEKTGGFVWSPFVLAPCLFIALSLFFINGNRSVREEVRRRVHF